MRIDTNFHRDWNGRQVESPQHQPCVAKSRPPNKVGTKPQTETIIYILEVTIARKVLPYDLRLDYTNLLTSFYTQSHTV